MTSLMKASIFLLTLSLLARSSSAFVGSAVQTRMLSALAAEKSSLNRRDAMLGIVAAFSSGTWAQPAAAKYSDYSRREKDWQERSQSGEVQYSSARQLRSQLQEIAPMNSASSKIFCPNGAPSNVSPLMENKCGDRLATPSVFGRQDDVMGNSIPGFKEGYFSDGGSSSMSAQVGGFPSYK
jgi:hypothetical protein